MIFGSVGCRLISFFQRRRFGQTSQSSSSNVLVKCFTPIQNHVLFKYCSSWNRAHTDFQDWWFSALLVASAAALAAFSSAFSWDEVPNPRRLPQMGLGNVSFRSRIMCFIFKCRSSWNRVHTDFYKQATATQATGLSRLMIFGATASVSCRLGSFFQRRRLGRSSQSHWSSSNALWNGLLRSRMMCYLNIALAEIGFTRTLQASHRNPSHRTFKTDDFRFERLCLGRSSQSQSPSSNVLVKA